MSRGSNGSPAPTFSVVLPTYNRAYILLDAVNSVLNQTYRDLELIIVDDGSTDETKDLVASITDLRVRYTRNTHSKGVAGARNSGIELAKGAWLCQIDSDDLWAPNMLELLAASALPSGPEIGIVYGSHALVDAGTGLVSDVRTAELSGATYPQMLNAHFFHHCCAAFRMTLVADLGGYDESLLLNEDTDFQLRATQASEMLPVPSAMYYYRIGRPDQVTKAYTTYVAAYQRFLEKHSDALAGLHGARFGLYQQVLHNCIRGGMWGQALYYWARIVPSVWRMPVEFLRYQKAAAIELAAKLNPKRPRSVDATRS